MFGYRGVAKNPDPDQAKNTLKILILLEKVFKGQIVCFSCFEFSVASLHPRQKMLLMHGNHSLAFTCLKFKIKDDNDTQAGNNEPR